jgi:hypothetical protein
MNRNKIAFAVGALTLAAAGAAAAQAPQVTVNDSPVQFLAQQPIEQGGRVLVPLRGVLEKLGAYVTYDYRTQTVSALRGQTRITLPIGGRQAVVDNRPVSLDVPAQLVNGSTMVPLRFVAEALGAQVTYNAGQNLVAINTGGGAGGGSASSAVLDNRAPSQTYNPNGSTGATGNAGDTASAVAETALNGTIVSIFEDLNPPRIVVRVPDANGTGTRDRTVPLRGDTRIQVRRPNQTDRTIAVRQIRRGDRVNVLLGDDNSAVAVNVLRDQAAGGGRRAGNANIDSNSPTTVSQTAPAVSGTFQGEFLDFRKTSSNLYVLKMTDGREIEVPGDVPVYYNNQKISVDDLRSGDNITLAVDPLTKRGTRLVVAVEQ